MKAYLEIFALDVKDVVTASGCQNPDSLTGIDTTLGGGQCVTCNDD